MLQPKLPPVISTKKRMRKKSKLPRYRQKNVPHKESFGNIDSKKDGKKDPDKAQEWLHDGWTSGLEGKEGAGFTKMHRSDKIQNIKYKVQNTKYKIGKEGAAFTKMHSSDKIPFSTAALL